MCLLRLHPISVRRSYTYPCEPTDTDTFYPSSVSLGFALSRGRAPRRPHVTADVVPPQASVRVPRSLPLLRLSVVSDELHVLSQSGVVAVGDVADLVRTSAQELASLKGRV